MADKGPVSTPDLLDRLRAASGARIGLGRVGQALPTAPMLAFQLAHARARDAVHAGMDAEALADALGPGSVVVDSAAGTRSAYLRDPDSGRRLSDASRGKLVPGACDLAVVIADGLSALAAQRHAPAVWTELARLLPGMAAAPPVVARLARVALGDEIGERLGARCVVVLIGERPGLSAADSLGAYVTWEPRRGRRDSERNCISNIRDPGGLPPLDAAAKIAWILREARQLGGTGVHLKDREGQDRLA